MFQNISSLTLQLQKISKGLSICVMSNMSYIMPTLGVSNQSLFFEKIHTCNIHTVFTIKMCVNIFPSLKQKHETIWRFNGTVLFVWRVNTVPPKRQWCIGPLIIHCWQGSYKSLKFRHQHAERIRTKLITSRVSWDLRWSNS